MIKKLWEKYFKSKSSNKDDYNEFVEVNKTYYQRVNCIRGKDTVLLQHIDELKKETLKYKPNTEEFRHSWQLMNYLIELLEIRELYAKEYIEKLN